MSCYNELEREYAELKYEHDQLRKCYDVTNQSWKELKSEVDRLRVENEKLKTVAIAANAVYKELFEPFIIAEIVAKESYMNLHKALMIAGYGSDYNALAGLEE